MSIKNQTAAADEGALAKGDLPPFMQGKGKGKKEPKESKDDEAEDDDKDEDEDEAKKSVVLESDLIKSAEALERLARGSGANRRQELLQKSMSASLTDAETEELVKLIKPAPADSPVAKSMEIEKGTPAANALDVSEFLAEFHKSTTSVLTTLHSTLVKSEAASSEREAALAHGLAQQGKALVALSRNLAKLAKSLEALERQPAREPRALQQPPAGGAGLAKSTTGGGSTIDPQQPQRQQVLDALEQLMAKSTNQLDATGVDYMHTISRFESTGYIEAPVLHDVQRVLRGQG